MLFCLSLHLHVALERLDPCVLNRIKLIADFERRFDHRGVPLVFGKTQVRTDFIVAAFKMADNRLACEPFVEFHGTLALPLFPNRRRGP
jgi:hypothetical protein